jgi:hypothetical protein
MSNGGYDFPDLKRGIEKRRRNCGDSKLKRNFCLKKNFFLCGKNYLRHSQVLETGLCTFCFLDKQRNWRGKTCIRFFSVRFVLFFVCQKNEIFGNHCMTRHCTRNMLRHRTAFVFVEFQFRPRCAGTRQRLERGVSASARGISGIAGICIVFPLIPMVGLRLWVGFG